MYPGSSPSKEGIEQVQDTIYSGLAIILKFCNHFSSSDGVGGCLLSKTQGKNAFNILTRSNNNNSKNIHIVRNALPTLLLLFSLMENVKIISLCVYIYCAVLDVLIICKKVKRMKPLTCGVPMFHVGNEYCQHYFYFTH